MGEGKVVPMEGPVAKESVAQPQKMSYEQLENIAHQLSDQNRQLHADLLKAQETGFFKRLDYLFKVVEDVDAFSFDFYTKCVQEIETLMAIPEDLPIEENPNKD